ncbi:hypothetical protein V4Y02_23875, partial [Escherichia coli]
NFTCFPFIFSSSPFTFTFYSSRNLIPFLKEAMINFFFCLCSPKDEGFKPPNCSLFHQWAS